MLTEAAKSAAVTHNHPEGIKGAQAVCFAISMALEKWSKHEIQLNIEHRYDYDLHRSVKHIRQDYQFNETCPGSVPEAIICFLEANSFEETIRLAVSIGGDSDTIAAIAGSIAESYYLIPENIKSQALAFIPGDMRTIVEQFYNTIQNG
jgi:ADP-ribosylglycohydrolase